MTDKPDNSYKPDYGLSRLNAGVGGNADHFFSGFRLYSLGVFDFGQYSTMVEISRDGHPHALSLDFNQQQLRQILSKASPGLAAFLKQEISRDPGSPLGQMQVIDGERFVPFAAQETK